MRCASCGTENENPARFCLECGTEFLMACPYCKTKNPIHHKFCGACGNQFANKCPGCGFINLPDQKFCGSCNRQLAEDSMIKPAAPAHADVAAAVQAPAAPPSVQTPAGPPSPSPQMIPPQASPPPAAPVSTAPGSQSDVSAKASETSPVILPPPDTIQRTALAEKGSDFNPPGQLEEFALGSVELMNFAQLASAAVSGQSPAGASAEETKNALLRDKQALLNQLESRITALNGKIESIHNNVLFFSFRQEATIRQSLEVAVNFACNVLEKNINLAGMPLKLRFGLDLELADNRNPITSTTERSVASPGQLVVSRKAYELLKEAESLEFEAIGPLRMGNQMVTYYKIRKHRAKATSEIPSLAAATQPKETEAMAGAGETPEVPIPGNLPEASPPETDIFSSAEQEGRIDYHPPVFGQHQPPKTPNTSYEKSYATLAEEFNTLLEAGADAKGKVFSLIANDGLGKSYITQCLRHQMDPDPQSPQAFWLGGSNYRCFHGALPLYFWLELIQNPFGFVFEGHPSDQAKTYLHQILNQLFNGKLPDETLSFFLDFLSVNPTQPISVNTLEHADRITHYLGEFFATLAAQKPVVLILEDLQYADPASLDLLSRLIQNGLLDKSVHLILTYSRDFALTGDLGKVLAMAPHRELILSDLNEEESSTLLNAGPMAGHLDILPDLLLNQLLQNAGGLPLHLIYSLRVLHQKGILLVDEKTGKFKLSNTMTEESMLLPVTLDELIRTQLGAISSEALYTLQVASVLGEKFSIRLLMDLCKSEDDETSEHAFNKTLEELFNYGFIIPDAANSCRFAHGRLWQCVYNQTDLLQRNNLHSLVGEYLEKALTEGYTVNPALIAYHSEQADQATRAFTYWNMSAAHTAQAGSLSGTNIAMFRAIDLLDAATLNNKPTIETLLYESIGVLNSEENPDLAVRVLKKAAYARKAENNTNKLIEDLGILAACFSQQGNFQDELATLEQSLQRVPAGQYPAEHVTLLAEKLRCLITMGKIQAGRNLLDTMTPMLKALPKEERSPYPELQVLSLRAQLELAQCDSRAFDTLNAGLALSEEARDEALALELNLTRSHGFLLKGNYAGCTRHLEELLTQIETAGMADETLARWGLIAMQHHCDMGDWANASMLIPNTLYQSERARDYLTWITTSIYSGWITIGQGQKTQGREALENAIMLASDYRLVIPALTGWRFLAETEKMLGSKDVAAEIAENALKIAQKPEINHRYEIFRLSNTYARCLINLDRAKEAGKLLEPIWPQVIQTGFSPLIADTAYSIGLLYQNLAGLEAGPVSQKHRGRAAEFLAKARGLWKETGNSYQVQLIENGQK